MDISDTKRRISVDYLAVIKEIQFLKYINDNPVYYQTDTVLKAIYR